MSSDSLTSDSLTNDRLTHASHWRLLRHCHRGQVPGDWRPWLEDRGSLTRRLVARGGGDFRVEILRQRVARPTPSEARALGLPPGRRAMIREVILWGRSRPWVFARSIIPLTTLTGRQRRLRQLDDRPLGHVLFSDNSMRRGPVAVARIPGATLPAPVTAPGTRLWGRRSVFHLDGKPLLVAEIFLPAFTP